jgi:hypothetical protein
MELKNVSIALVVAAVVGCASPEKPRAAVATDRSSLSLIASMAEHMERENEDIARDAVSIREDISSADKDLDSLYGVVPEASQETLDIAIDKMWEAEQNAKQIADSAARLQEEIDKLEVVTAQVKAVEDRVVELQGVEAETRAKAMEKLYGYITLFFALGFIIVTAGAALAFFVNKSLGFMIMLVGGIMIGFAAASQYYLQQIALVGGILLAVLVASGLVFILLSALRGKKKDEALAEIVGIIKVLMETMEPGEKERIFGDGGLASKAKSQMTRDIISEMSSSVKS